MWPFVAIYVPKVHGDIPPSLMVLYYVVLNRPSEKSADVIVVMDVNAYILHYQRVIDDCVLHYDASYT